MSLYVGASEAGRQLQSFLTPGEVEEGGRENIAEIIKVRYAHEVLTWIFIVTYYMKIESRLLTHGGTDILFQIHSFPCTLLPSFWPENLG